MEEPLFVVVRGLPGSGKSVLVNNLVRLPFFAGSVRLDPDRVDQTSQEFCDFIAALSSNVPPKKMVYRYLLRWAEKALREGKSVIWEQPWRRRWGIEITIENLTYFLIGETAFGYAPFQPVIVEVEIGPEEAKRRVAARFASGEHPLDVGSFDDFVGHLEPCHQLGVPFIRVDGSMPSARVVQDVERFVSDLQKGRDGSADLFDSTSCHGV